MARLRFDGLATGSAPPRSPLTLGAALDDDDTTITFPAALTYSGGAVPTIAGGDYLALSLLDSAGCLAEVVHLTAYTSGGTTGTIVRGVEGSTAQAHASGAVLRHGATALDVSGITGIAGSSGTSSGTSHTVTLTHPTGILPSDRLLLFVSTINGATAWSGDASSFGRVLLPDNKNQLGNKTYALTGLMSGIPSSPSITITTANENLAWAALYVRGGRGGFVAIPQVVAYGATLTLPAGIGPFVGVVYGTSLTAGDAVGLPSFGAGWSTQVEAHSTTSVYVMVRAGINGQGIAGGTAAVASVDYATIALV